MFLALFVIVIVLFYYYAVYPMSYWIRRGVKQTKPLWFFGDAAGNFFRFSTFSDHLHKIYHSYTDVRYLGYYEFAKPVLMIKDINLIKKICIKDLDSFTDHRRFVPDEADPLWSKNLFALEGEAWREMRRILSPAFTSNKMKTMYSLMKECTNDVVTFFKNHNDDTIEISLKDVTSRFANDVVATTAFGIRVNSLKEQENDFYLSGMQIADASSIERAVKLFLVQFISFLPKLTNVYLFQNPARSYFVDLIKNTLRARREKGIIRADMIQLLMEAQKEHRDGNIFSEITDDIIASQAIIFFFAGFESVSSFMTFMGYELALNTDVQDKLRAEIEEAFDECNGNLTYDALFKMKYLDMVTSETLRKWPSFSSTDRICTKEFVIEPELPSENKLVIEKGTQLEFPTMAIHNDITYFSNPERFDPERFSSENKDKFNQNAYFPFGIGPRICVGNRFALMETKILFAYLLLNFELIPNAKTPVPMKLSAKQFSVHPEGPVSVTLRKLKS